MTLRPYKFLITPIAQQIDDTGAVTGEVTLGNGPQPLVVFGCEALAEFAEKFPDTLAEAEKAQ